MPATLVTLKVLLVVFWVTVLGPLMVPGAVGVVPPESVRMRWLLEPPQLTERTLSVPLLKVLATIT